MFRISEPFIGPNTAAAQSWTMFIKSPTLNGWSLLCICIRDLKLAMKARASPEFMSPREAKRWLTRLSVWGPETETTIWPRKSWKIGCVVCMTVLSERSASPGADAPGSYGMGATAGAGCCHGNGAATAFGCCCPCRSFASEDKYFCHTGSYLGFVPNPSFLTNQSIILAASE